MIESIEPQGVLIHDSIVPGETRGQGIVPAHPNGLQLSADRWLILQASRGYRGLDDDRSVIYQLRRDTPAGPVIKEGCLARTSDEWDPLGDGSRFVKQCGHPVGFGVPKGAIINGRPAPHANLFAITWRTSPRVLDRQRNYLLLWSEVETPPVDAVEWVQFRLNDADDDIELLGPPVQLRQKGYEHGPAFCSHEQVKVMNQSFVAPVAADGRAEQWVGVNHFGGSLAAIRFAFNPGTGRYEWTQTGPFLNGWENSGQIRLIEGSTVRRESDWLVACRTPWSDLRIAWFRGDDLFSKPSPAVLSDAIKSDAPHTAYLCPDGVLRVFGGDATVSPHGRLRCPLYAWDIDPERGFAATSRRVVFDAIEAGLPFPVENNPTVDMAKLLPHPGGSTGYLLHRVRSDTVDFPSVITQRTITPAERNASAIYWAKINYDRPYPGRWQFGKN